MSVEIPDSKIIAETDKAVLVEANEYDDSFWVPQSQIHDDSEIWTKGQSGTLVISNWFAEKEGFI